MKSKEKTGVLFLILFVNILMAQDGFFKKYYNPPSYNEYISCVLQTGDSTVILIGGGDPHHEDEGWHVFMRTIDANTGEELAKSDFGPIEGHTVHPEEALINRAGDVLIAGLAYDDNIPRLGLGKFFVLAIDQNHEVLWWNYFGSSFEENWRAQNITQTESGKYALSGYRLDTIRYNYQEAVCMGMNEQGDSLWTRIIAKERDDLVGYNVAPAGHNSIFFHYTDEELDHFKVHKIDMTTGQDIWVNSYPMNEVYFISSESDEQCNLYLGGTKLIGNNVYPVFAKLDTNGVLQWSQSYESEISGWGEKFCLTKEKGLAMCLRHRYPTLFVTDSMGDFLFSKSYSLEENLSPTDITQLADGGFLIAGRMWVDTIWTIRTLADGNISSVSGIEWQSLDFSLYPNPTTLNLTLNLDNNPRGYNVKIVNNMGKVVMSTKFFGTTTLNVSHLPQSTYYINVFIEGQLMASRSFLKL